jgi:hypothetical protein
VADKPMDVYLNDHLAGAVMGSDLAEQIRSRAEGTPLGETMAPVAAQIEEDRQTLLDLMDALGVAKNPVKQATTWFAEKASRVKFSGATSGEPDVGLFMALESMMLGVSGKLALWEMLQRVADQHRALAGTDFDGLIARARHQRDVLEEERLALGAIALSG